MADEINSLAKSKNKEKKDEANAYVQPEKRKQIINDLSYFRHHIKMENKKTTILLGNIPDKVSRFFTKNG